MHNVYVYVQWHACRLHSHLADVVILCGPSSYQSPDPSCQRSPNATMVTLKRGRHPITNVVRKGREFRGDGASKKKVIIRNNRLLMLLHRIYQ